MDSRVGVGRPSQGGSVAHYALGEVTPFGDAALPAAAASEVGRRWYIRMYPAGVLIASAGICTHARRLRCRVQVVTRARGGHSYHSGAAVWKAQT